MSNQTKRNNELRIQKEKKKKRVTYKDLLNFLDSPVVVGLLRLFRFEIMNIIMKSTIRILYKFLIVFGYIVVYLYILNLLLLVFISHDPYVHFYNVFESVVVYDFERVSTDLIV